MSARKVSKEEFHNAINTGSDCVIRNHKIIERVPWYRRHSGALVGFMVITDGEYEYELWEEPPAPSENV